VNFDSHVDGVVALSTALVNVATPGHRQGSPYAVPTGADLTRDLTEVLSRGRDRGPALTRQDCADLTDLAGAAAPVFTAMDGGDTALAATHVNALLDRYRPTPVLQRHDGEPWHLHFHGPTGSDPTGWGGAVAVALATVLGSDYADRLGRCAAPHCDRAFVDVSRNGTRRFCSTACQNRVKAATHRARHSGQS
jgi:hypothetical protein